MDIGVTKNHSKSGVRKLGNKSRAKAFKEPGKEECPRVAGAKSDGLSF